MLRCSKETFKSNIFASYLDKIKITNDKSIRISK